MKKIIIILILMFPLNIFALSYGGCSYSEVSRMKESVKNINISYDYHIENNTAYFDITLVNLTPDIYFYDKVHDRTYSYYDTNQGEITIGGYLKSGSYKFYSNNANCIGINAGTLYYTLPTYNPYYLDPLCKGLSNYKLCKKWGKLDYTYDEFKKMLEEKKNTAEEEIVETQYEDTTFEKILNFYAKYYYFFLLGIIGICLAVLYIKKYQSRL